MKKERISLSESRPEVGLTAYIQEENHEFGKAPARPAVIVCPGGAYCALSFEEAEPVALRFLGMGYHAFVLEYSVSFGDFRKMYREETGSGDPAANHPGPLLELCRAMLAIRENAERWRLDPESVVLCGFSAGGHLAATLAARYNEPWLAQKLGCTSKELRPAAAILSYPVVDIQLAMQMPHKDERDRKMFRQCLAAICGSVDPDAETLAEVSPVRFVSPDTPPCFIWATADDETVSCGQAMAFASALSDAGVPFELHIFEHGPHGLSLADRSTAVSPETNVPEVAKWVTLAEAWLTRHVPHRLRGE